MLDPDYMELLGVLAPTEHNAPARAFLEKRGEGIERVAFTRGGCRSRRRRDPARGYPLLVRPISSGPVTMPTASLSAAKFRTFQWPSRSAAAFASSPASTDTRDRVDSRTHEHANGAKGLRQVLIVTPQPADDAAHCHA